MAQPQLGYPEAFPAPANTIYQSPRDLIEAYTGDLVEVPMSFIDHDEVPVDKLHVQELAASMVEQAARDGSSHGQIIPVLLVEVIGREKLAIGDGFHRDSALVRNDSPVALATLRLNKTEEELGDLRIVTATSHKGVAFARQIEWIDALWARTPWASEDFTAGKAFALLTGKVTAAKLGLSNEQSADVIEWATDKCQKWNATPRELQENLSVAQGVDPALIKEVRAKGPGLEPSMLTPKHIVIFNHYLPYDYRWQNLAAKVIRDKKLTANEARRMAAKIAKTHDFDTATTIAHTTDWQQKSPARHRLSRSAVVRPAPQRPALPPPIPEYSDDRTEPGLAYRLATLELSCARLALDASFLRGTFMPSGQGERQSANWTVTRRDDPEIAELVAPRDTSDFVLAIYDHLERSGETLADRLQEKHKLDETTANRLLQRVSSRITEDIDTGDLRFVTFNDTDDFAVRRLVVASLRDELARYGNMSQPTVMAKQLEAVSHSLPNIIRAFPKMPDAVRQAVVMSGLIGLSLQTTARLLRVRASVIPDYLQKGVTIINKSQADHTLSA